jgi:U3 small nucleolar RNA-associated protein 22
MSLHPFLMSIPAVEPTHPLRAAESLYSLPAGKNKKSAKAAFVPVFTPYCAPIPTESTNWKVAFAPPTDVTIVGSWATETRVKGQDEARFGIDLALEMPEVSLTQVVNQNVEC